MINGKISKQPLWCQEATIFFCSQSIIFINLADVGVGVSAGVVIVEALAPGALVERELHAVLDAVRVVGLSRQPVDGRVGEPGARGAPAELERTPLVAAGRPEYFVVELGCG